MTAANGNQQIPLGGDEGLLPRLRAIALSNGVTEVGACSAEPFPEVKAAIEQRVATGLSGPLKFTYANPAVATDIRVSIPWAESLVVLGMPYLSQSQQESKGRGEIARFATADHYQALQAALGAVKDELRRAGFQATPVYDDNQLVDRAAANRAGLGWWGRNTMIITPGVGPWMLLGTVVTDAPIAPTPPVSRNCGTCFACTPACPTGALDTPGILDGRRCLATWLQSPQPTPLHLRPLIGGRVYGCDDCLTACPPGIRYLEGEHDPKGYRPADVGDARVDISEMLRLTDEQLVERFPHFYLPKRDGKYLRRNLLVALANTSETAVELYPHLEDRSSVVRAAAAWGLGRWNPEGAATTLRERIEAEGVQSVRDELYLGLLSVEFSATYQELLRVLAAVFLDEGVSFMALIGSHSVGEGNSESDLDLQVGVERPDLADPGALGVPSHAVLRSVPDAQIWSWTNPEGLAVELALVAAGDSGGPSAVQTGILKRGVVSLIDRAGDLATLRKLVR